MGDRLATIDIARKVGAAVPLSVGLAESPSDTVWPGPRPISKPSDIWIHPAVWQQQTRAENWGTVLIWGGAVGLHLTQRDVG